MPAQTAPVTIAHEHAERLARISAVHRQQVAECARIRDRALALARDNAQFTAEVSTKLLLLDAVLANHK
jgi:hypothetical protein